MCKRDRAGNCKLVVSVTSHDYVMVTLLGLAAATDGMFFVIVMII